jgi:ABC-2 type transport system permease protein
MFVRDKTKGLLPLVLSKPISRTKYIISKFVSLGTLILVSLFIGYLVFGYYTFFLFDEVDMLGLFYGTLLYFVYIIYILSLSMFASTHSKSYILAVVITFGGMMLFGLLALFNVGVFKFLPGLIITNIMELLTDSFVISDIIWNVVVTLIISAIFMTLSILRFKKQDI